MKDINFFSIYSNKNSVTYKKNRLIKIGALVFAIILIIYAGLSVWLMIINSQTQEINDYLMTEKVQKSMAEYNAATSRLGMIQEYDNLTTGLIDSLGSMNNLTTETLGIITKSLPVTAKIETINYGNGSFSFSISAPSMQVVAQTVVRLEETKLFDQVVLGSVSITGEGNGYNGSIQATMKVGEQ